MQGKEGKDGRGEGGRGKGGGRESVFWCFACSLNWQTNCQGSLLISILNFFFYYGHLFLQGDHFWHIQHLIAFLFLQVFHISQFCSLISIFSWGLFICCESNVWQCRCGFQVMSNDNIKFKSMDKEIMKLCTSNHLCNL